MMKIGIFGGTFDPVHTGHLVLAQEAWFVLGLDKVIFVPAYIPPHKKISGEVSPADRLNMLRIALDRDERFEISTYEMDKGAVCYSVDTASYFRSVYGCESEYFFIAGADSAEELHTWKDPEVLLGLVNFTAAVRKGHSAESKYEDRICRIEMPLIDVSSSMLRDRLKQRKPVDYLIPAEVVAYIRKKGLYR
jgi:nicotinate-nucleotide adenylyltransferase